MAFTPLHTAGLPLMAVKGRASLEFLLFFLLMTSSFYIAVDAEQ